MFIYWAMFLIPATAALSTTRFNRQVTDLGWILLAIIFVLIIGLRFEVGIDWFATLSSFNSRSGDTSLLDAVTHGRYEPAIALLGWLANQMDIGIWVVNLISSVIFVSGLAIFCRRQPFPWLSLVIAIPFLVIVIGMGYTRQAAAIGFFLLALVSLTDGYAFRFVFLVALGALFHPTVLLFIPLALLVYASKNVFSLRNFWTLFWVSLIGAWLFENLLAEYLDILKTYYFGIRMTAEGGFIRVMMCTIPATIFLLLRKRFNLNLRQLRLWTWMSIASILLLLLVKVLPSSSAVDRLGFYLIPIQLFVYSRLPLLFRGGISRQMFTSLLIVGYAIVQIVFLNYGTHAHGWLPYKIYPSEFFLN